MSFGRGDSVEHAAERVIVVVLDEAGQGGFRFGQSGNTLSVPDLGLQYR